MRRRSFIAALLSLKATRVMTVCSRFLNTNGTVGSIVTKGATTVFTTQRGRDAQ